MSRDARPELSLFQQSALRLFAVFAAFLLLLATTVVFLLLVPMAKQAAGDLVSLMVLSAQTWSELPPETRPAFTRELESSHRLIVRTSPSPGAEPVGWHGPYAEELENRLAQRVGMAVVLSSSSEAGETWHWVELPSGERTLWLGFPHSRIGTQPLAAVLITLGAAALFAILAALWLARRIVAPLERLAGAAATLGRGEKPELLPEAGPREIAALAGTFNRLTRQIGDLLDARTTLLAGLSHDLRTPLARMRLALEMLRTRPDAAWIDRVERDSEEMNHLVGDMLELARGLGQEAAVDVDLAALLDELARRAGENGAKVVCTGERPGVRAPQRALARVIGNLLDNALRHGNGSTVELHTDASRERLRIGVLDGGPGIPQDQLEAVFRPFHRVDGSRSRDTGGTGLGLAIVAQLAQANGWRVTLENRGQGGLAAWLILPGGESDRPGI